MNKRDRDKLVAESIMLREWKTEVWNEITEEYNALENDDDNFDLN